MGYVDPSPNHPTPSAHTSQTYKLNTWIADYNKACPATKIMLIGYSSGGIMAMNSLCGTSPPGYAPIAHLPGAKYGPVGTPPSSSPHH